MHIELPIGHTNQLISKKKCKTSNNIIAYPQVNQNDNYISLFPPQRNETKLIRSSTRMVRSTTNYKSSQQHERIKTEPNYSSINSISMSPNKQRPLRPKQLQRSGILNSPSKNVALRISQEQKVQLRYKLQNIDNSIKFIQNRRCEGNVGPSFTEMLQDLKNSIQLQKQCKTEQLVITEPYKNKEQEIVPEILHHNIFCQSIKPINQLIQLQRQKLLASKYYNSRKWKKCRDQILHTLRGTNGNKLIHIQTVITRIKIPYLRDNSKLFFRLIQQRNYTEVSNLLGKQKYLVYEVDANRSTPLHISCQFGLFEISKLLLRCGASVNTIDKHRKTPLYYAVCNGFLDIIKILIINSAYVWSTKQCNYSLFNNNSGVEQLMKVAKRIVTILLLVPANKKETIQQYILQSYLYHFKLPQTLMQ